MGVVGGGAGGLGIEDSSDGGKKGGISLAPGGPLCAPPSPHYAGDMDFKVAGDRDAITAFQMDIKVEGITLDIMRQALQQVINMGERGGGHVDLRTLCVDLGGQGWRAYHTRHHEAGRGRGVMIWGLAPCEPADMLALPPHVPPPSLPGPLHLILNLPSPSLTLSHFASSGRGRAPPHPGRDGKVQSGPEGGALEACTQGGTAEGELRAAERGLVSDGHHPVPVHACSTHPPEAPLSPHLQSLHLSVHTFTPLFPD